MESTIQDCLGLPYMGRKQERRGGTTYTVMQVGRSNFHCGNHKRYHLYHVISSDILIVIRYCGFKKMFKRARIAEFTL